VFTIFIVVLKHLRPIFCNCGNDQVRYMILEIPDDEFTYKLKDRIKG
jgi:hypothetical protein